MAYVGLGKQLLVHGTAVIDEATHRAAVQSGLGYFEQAVDAQPDDVDARQHLQRATAYRDGTAALSVENWPLPLKGSMLFTAPRRIIWR